MGHWIVGDGMSEYIGYYNATGHVMHFARVDGARETTDRREAERMATVARELYGRKRFRAIYREE